MNASGSGRKGTIRARNQAMAGFLKASGYPHGKRASVTHAPPSPNLNDVGSAAYRRRVAK